MNHLRWILPLLLTVILLVSPHLRWLDRALLGDLRLHPVDSAWLYALTQDALWQLPPGTRSSLFQDPTRIDVVGVYADIGNAVLASPLTAWLGPVLAYNLFQLLQLAAAGLAAGALAWHLTRSRTAAFTSGLLFMHSDALWFAVRWGEDDVSAMWLIPACLVLLLRALPQGSRVPPRHALVASGVFLALVGYFNSYYLFFCALLAGLAWLEVFLRTCRLEARRQALPDVLGAGLMWVGSAGLAYLPRALLGVRQSRVGLELHTADYLRTWADYLRPHPAFNLFSNLDLGAFLNPISPSRHHAARIGLQEGCLYLGLAALGLAVVGIWKGRLERSAAVAWVGVLGLVLSLGAYLKLEGELVGAGGLSVIPLPQGVLAHWLPFMARMNHPYRFSILVYLAVAVGAGAGVATLAHRLNRRLEERASSAPLRTLAVALLTGTLAGACVGERVWATPGIVPLRASTLHIPAVLPPRPAGGEIRAILHLPFPEPHELFMDLEPHRYHRALQLFSHQRPLFFDPDLPWLKQEVSRRALEASLTWLSQRGVGWILLTPRIDAWCRDTNRGPGLIQPLLQTQLPLATRQLRRCLRPFHLDADVEIYALGTGDIRCNFPE